MQVTKGGIQDAQRCCLEKSIALIHVRNEEELELICDGLVALMEKHADDKVFGYLYKKAEEMERGLSVLLDLISSQPREKKNVKLQS